MLREVKVNSINPLSASVMKWSHSNNSSATTDELFECVQPFRKVGTLKCYIRLILSGIWRQSLTESLLRRIGPRVSVKKLIGKFSQISRNKTWDAINFIKYDSIVGAFSWILLDISTPDRMFIHFLGFKIHLGNLSHFFLFLPRKFSQMIIFFVSSIYSLYL